MSDAAKRVEIRLHPSAVELPNGRTCELRSLYRIADVGRKKNMKAVGRPIKMLAADLPIERPESLQVNAVGYHPSLRCLHCVWQQWQKISRLNNDPARSLGCMDGSGDADSRCDLPERSGRIFAQEVRAAKRYQRRS